MKALIIFLLCFFSVRAQTSEKCPIPVTCTSSETIDSCPKDTYLRENVAVHGCCPGCVGGLKNVTEACFSDDECLPGLVCTIKGTSGTCQKDTNGQWCAVFNLTPNDFFTPICLPDGTYAPKQCKGEKQGTGRCFCYDEKGDRLFGEEDYAKADNMTCACSRLVAEMKKTLGRTDITIHCDDWGNFEKLQCDQGLCWCGDTYTGDPYTPIVPEKLMERLPCYDDRDVGMQYLRQCDSEMISQIHGEKLISNHGTNNIHFAEIRCNPDGSFDRYQLIDNKKKCTYRNKEILTEGIGQDDVHFPLVDCNCAYDKKVAALKGIKFDKECEAYGNYKNRQMSAGKYYCVDKDGFPTKDLFDEPNPNQNSCDKIK